MFRYFKIYRDDGFGITKVKRTIEEMQTWFESFQKIVDKLTSGDIQFTMEIWRPDEKSREIKKGVIDVIGGNSMPYLDTQMYYNMFGKLQFKVYSKPGFKMKYIKRTSMHTNMCVNAIEKGVSIQLASLT